jgi:curli biogenesis system outer membrane secretion channel CsgG
VTGEVTEFKENKIGALAVGVNQAHIGFILRIVDPQTTEVLWSESVQRKVTRPGLKIFNADIISFGTQAMEDALEKAILDAVGLIVGQRV